MSKGNKKEVGIIEVLVTKRKWDFFYSDVYACPSCEEITVHPWDNFCPYCGSPVKLVKTEESLRREKLRTFEDRTEVIPFSVENF
jgi:rRNA maturation endonuclease Nob1